MTGGPTYYDQPVLQSPVWVWAVPAYFYVGGTAAAALVLGWAAQSVDGRGLRGLVQRCRWIGAGGIAVGTGLLIYDLGRPARFLNMLRVFRPSSPLSIGSWLLAGGGAAASSAAVLGWLGGPFRRCADRAGHTAGLLGLPLAGYTGVVLADTALPAWQEARRTLPALFIGSSMAGAASLLDLTQLGHAERRVVKYFGIAGKAAELAGAAAVEQEVSRVAYVARPYRQGATGLLWTAAKVFTAASLALSLWPGGSRRKRLASAIAGSAGAICVKFAAFEAGKASAADPRATFRRQRSLEAPAPDRIALAPERAMTGRP